MRTKILHTAIILFMSVLTVNANHLSENLLITASLDGAQEVPSVTTNALGVAGLILNATRDTLCLRITVTGLSGPITGAHIHEGDPGVSGGIIIDLSPYIIGNDISGTLTGSDVSLTNISKLLSGKFYVNVHTTANPNGEIRGQLYLETDWSFPVMLDGSQEVPPVAVNAYGVGVFNLSKDLSKLSFHIVVQGLSDTISASHLHGGAFGVSGGVVENLSTFVNGNVISGTILAPSQALIDSMMAGNIYVNVHTSVNPAGEIRSQLTNEKSYLYFDAMLDGNQEFPPVTTTGMGAATIKLNTTFDTLWYDIAVDSLSGSIAAAHFHYAEAGTSGAVVVDLTTNVVGNRITGTITGASLTTELVNQFLEGEIYVNAHTASFPDGEIRGQVYRVVREGYTMSFDGTQEVPAVASPATGTGVASMDRDMDNLHFMIATDGLTATSAHFHYNVTGQSGSVIYDLLPFWNNGGAFGFWKSSDATPFTVASASAFINDSVYANVHTSANPTGEIRGQANRGFQCYQINIGIDEFENLNGAIINVYPNPTSGILKVEITSTVSKQSTLTILDILGKEIYSKEFALNAGIAHLDIDTRQFANGMYTLRIRNEDGQVNATFIRN